MAMWDSGFYSLHIFLLNVSYFYKGKPEKDFIKIIMD